MTPTGSPRVEPRGRGQRAVISHPGKGKTLEAVLDASAEVHHVGADAFDQYREAT